jgi:hypothetical protein
MNDRKNLIPLRSNIKDYLNIFYHKLIIYLSEAHLFTQFL